MYLKKIMIENQKKRENRKIEEIFTSIYFHLKDGVGMEFTACKVELLPEGALTSFTISDSYHDFVGIGVVVDVTK